jgi:hypothetical protein
MAKTEQELFIMQLVLEAGKFANDATKDHPTAFEGVFLGRIVELAVAECARIAELKEQGYADYDKDMSVGWYMREKFGFN